MRFGGGGGEGCMKRETEKKKDLFKSVRITQKIFISKTRFLGDVPDMRCDASEIKSGPK